MSLLNPEKNLLHEPTAKVLQPAFGQHQIVFGLKMHPPINFNLMLKAHAEDHGLKVHNIGFHPHPTGIKLSLNVSGHLDKVKSFADSAIGKFDTYIRNAEVKFGGQMFRYGTHY